MTTPDPHPLLAELRRIRIARRVTQQALADRLGLHRNTIDLWERGERRPAPSELCRWAAALDHDVALHQVKEPAPPTLAEVQAERRAVLERETWLAGELDDYAELRAQGLSNGEIAARMRVHVSTARRYGRRLAALGEVA